MIIIVIMIMMISSTHMAIPKINSQHPNHYAHCTGKSRDDFDGSPKRICFHAVFDLPNQGIFLFIMLILLNVLR